MNIFSKHINTKRFLGYYMYINRRPDMAAGISMYGTIQILRSHKPIPITENILKTMGIDAKIYDLPEAHYIRVRFKSQEDMNLFKSVADISPDPRHIINGQSMYRYNK